MEKINVKWDEAMSFTASVDGFEIKLDAAAEHGGSNLGPRPKPLMMVALAGCTGMDIASLAKKMRVQLASFDIDVEAEKSEEMPVVFTSMTLIYKFMADEADTDKIIKMVTMSQERYCGVAAMLSKATTLGYRIELNGKVIKS